MKFYAVLHLPTMSLFPLMRSGSSYYDFFHPPKREKHKDPLPPRLFESRRLANRYITEYCKGIRNSEFGVAGARVEYVDTIHPRLVDHFKVVEIKLELSDV